jgi:hypothetical protein
MTNRELKRALLKKLGVSKQAISQRVRRLIEDRPMTTEDATYLIAHESGIPLDRYLDSAEMDRVRTLMPTGAAQPGKLHKEMASRAKRSAPANRTIVIGKEFKGSDPILPTDVLSDAREMAAVYPLLYVLENSIREAINRIMQKHHGDLWWDSYSPQGLKDTVNKRMAEENINSWHQRRGAHPINYLDLNQLPAIVRKNERDFVPDMFRDADWFKHYIDDLYLSRCVLAHMNPLDKDNIEDVRLSFNKWQKLINSKRALLST